VDLVGLSDVQRAQTDSIYRYYQLEMRALHEEFDATYSSRYREIMSESREAMLGILTAEQRVVYDSLLVDWERRRQERRQDSVPPTGSPRGQR
jgi:Spy/CpxP family protein refolding chaperone